MLGIQKEFTYPQFIRQFYVFPPNRCGLEHTTFSWIFLNPLTE